MLAIALCALGPGCIARLIGGDYSGTDPYAFTARLNGSSNLRDPQVQLVRSAKALLGTATRDGVAGVPHDHHFHLLGSATGRSLACANMLAAEERQGLAPDRRLPKLDFTEDNLRLHPDYHAWLGIRSILRRALAKANRIDDEEKANQQYLKRILDLAVAADLGGTYYLYAFDYRFDPPRGGRKAQPNRDKSDLYVSNDYAIAVADCLTQLAAHLAARHNLRAPRFVPVASVHPYRPGALATLRRLSQQGVRYLKWLPPSQHIDPADPHHDAFYRELAAQNITLLSHTGKEHTLRVDNGDEDLGNPLRLRRALDAGATVVMLHAGREGEEDGRHNHPDGPQTYFARFLEMMRIDAYRGRLFGEISVLPYVGTHTLLTTLFADPDLRCRLVDGSDYPNPALGIVRHMSRSLFAADGPLRWSSAEPTAAVRARRDALDAIRQQNPLLYDFVLKRSLRLEIDGKLQPLPAAVFYDLATKVAHPHKGCPGKQ